MGRIGSLVAENDLVHGEAPWPGEQEAEPVAAGGLGPPTV